MDVWLLMGYFWQIPEGSCGISYDEEILSQRISCRFRDTSEEIRALVIDGVGNWTELYPAIYLKDLHLKYLGWALSDQVSIHTAHGYVLSIEYIIPCLVGLLHILISMI